MTGQEATGTREGKFWLNMWEKRPVLQAAPRAFIPQDGAVYLEKPILAEIPADLLVPHWH